MAFNRPNTVRQSIAQDESWKAQGFVNLYLPRKAGGRTKIGAIPLRMNNSNEAALLDFLSKDPANLATFVSQLQAEFNLITNEASVDPSAWGKKEEEAPSIL